VHRFVAWILTFRNGSELPHHAGKDDSTTVPEDMGKLELIIHCCHESDSGSDSSYNCMLGKDDSEDDGEDNSEPEDSDDPDYGGRAARNHWNFQFRNIKCTGL
jgi:hypothetical protein